MIHNKQLDSLSAVSHHQKKMGDDKYHMSLLCGECGGHYTSMEDIAKHCNRKNFRFRTSKIKNYNKHTFDPTKTFFLIDPPPNGYEDDEDVPPPKFDMAHHRLEVEKCAKRAKEATENRRKAASSARAAKAAKARTNTEPLLKHALLPAFDGHFSLPAAQAQTMFRELSDMSGIGSPTFPAALRALFSIQEPLSPIVTTPPIDLTTEDNGDQTMQEDTAETVSTIPPSMPYISSGTEIQLSQNPRSTPSNSSSTDINSSDPLEHHPKQTTHTITAPPPSLPLDTQLTMDVSPGTTVVGEPSSGTGVALVPGTPPQTSGTTMPGDTVDTATDMQPTSRTPPGLRSPQDLPTPGSVDGVGTLVVMGSRPVQSGMGPGGSVSTPAPVEALRATTTTPPSLINPPPGVFSWPRGPAVSTFAYTPQFSSLAAMGAPGFPAPPFIRRPPPVHPVQPHPIIQFSAGNTAPMTMGQAYPYMESLVHHLRWLSRLLLVTYANGDVPPTVQMIDQGDRSMLQATHFWPDQVARNTPLTELIQQLLPLYTDFLTRNDPKD